MGKSSKDKRDIYYRKAKEEGYRARSAFKLLQIQEEFNIFQNVERVVDLCAAPGSWSQVLSKQIYQPQKDNPAIKIVSVDLQDIAPIEGVIRIKGDITKLSTAEQIVSHFEGKLADLVVSDGAPDVTGLHDLDQYVQSQLILAALNITTHVLRVGGTFLAKIFRGKDISLMYAQLKIFFPFVTVVKPKSSRNSSLEAFILCQNYSPPEGYTPTMINPMLDKHYDENTPMTGPNSIIVPFLACGDLSGYDADQTYQLDDNYIPHEPIQKPIDPPYKKALSLKKSRKLDSQVKGSPLKRELQEEASKNETKEEETPSLDNAYSPDLTELIVTSDQPQDVDEERFSEDSSHDHLEKETTVRTSSKGESSGSSQDALQPGSNSSLTYGLMAGISVMGLAVAWWLKHK
jgi:tRNA (cytidine32/guanosine34-2'-O)-methyltransferase